MAFSLPGDPTVSADKTFSEAPCALNTRYITAFCKKKSKNSWLYLFIKERFSRKCPKRPPFIWSASSGCYNAPASCLWMRATIPQSLHVIALTSAHSDAYRKALLFSFKGHPVAEEADQRFLLLQDEKTKYIFHLYLMHTQSCRPAMSISLSNGRGKCLLFLPKYF
jgi:hypothetical protein